MKLNRSIRWLLLPFVACLGFYLAMSLSILASISFDAFCSESWRHLSLCQPDNHIFDGLVVINGAALAAVLAVLFPTLTAPSQRFFVASVFYVFGVIVTFWLTIPMQGLGIPIAPVAALAAVVAGAATVFWAKRFQR